MKKSIIRILFSLLLIAASFSCFYFPESFEITKEINSNPKIEETINNDGLISFFNYIGIFLLIYSVWLWRDELKFDQLGIISRSNVTPSDPKTVVSNLHINEQGDYKQTKSDFEKHKDKELKKKLLELLKGNYGELSNLDILSQKLKLSKKVIEEALFELQIEGKVRKDTYPGSMKANYSIKDSWLNRAIDNFVAEIEREGQVVISDARYLNIKGQFDVDALVETKDIKYIIEVKVVKQYIDKNVIERGLKQLLAIENIYRAPKPIKLVLLLATSQEKYKDVQKLLSEFEDIQDNLILKEINISK